MSLIFQESCVLSVDGFIQELGEASSHYLKDAEIGMKYSDVFGPSLTKLAEEIIDILRLGLDGDRISRTAFVIHQNQTTKVRLTGVNWIDDDMHLISLVINDASEEELIDIRSALSLPKSDHLLEDIEALRDRVRSLELDQAKLRAILNTNMQILLLIDLEFNIVSFNESAAKLSQVFWQRDLVFGRDIREYLPKELQPTFEGYFAQAARGETQYPTPQKAFGLGGKEFYFSVNYIPVFGQENQVEYVTFALMDITEKVLSERKLISTTATFDAVVKGSVISLLICDWDFRIIELNQSAHNLFLLGILPHNTFVIDDLIEDSQTVDRMRNELISVGRFTGESTAKRLNGELFPVEIAAVVSSDIESTEQRIYITIFDISERKNHERERELLIQELTKSNTELKQFSYITSHNMRAPLTNLIAILDLIDMGKIHDEETVEMIYAMRMATNNLNETLNDLIQILIIKGNSGISCLEVSLRYTLAKVTQSIQNMLSDSHTVITSDFDAPTILFDQKYMESIFLNLITNSIKYARPGVTPEIAIKSFRHRNEVIMTFTDNGLGFDIDKVKNRIFGLYQRFHANNDSKGIGLYLVHSQITSLGGEIEVFSEVNVGTTFTLRFRNQSK
ncbi:MAG: sensor histidine kinase [Flavobacteriales bacterium]